MDTQAVSIHQGEVVIDPSLLTPPDETGLKAERVQLVLQITMRRVEAPLGDDVGSDVTYVYELVLNRHQPVTVELPSITVTFHGDSAATAAMGSRG